jgi:hypothetical protein
MPTRQTFKNFGFPKFRETRFLFPRSLIPSFAGMFSLERKILQYPWKVEETFLCYKCHRKDRALRYGNMINSFVGLSLQLAEFSFHSSPSSFPSCRQVSRWTAVTSSKVLPTLIRRIWLWHVIRIYAAHLRDVNGPPLKLWHASIRHLRNRLGKYVS